MLFQIHVLERHLEVVIIFYDRETHKQFSTLRGGGLDSAREPLRLRNGVVLCELALLEVNHAARDEIRA